jgi:hypothetical protein
MEVSAAFALEALTDYVKRNKEKMTRAIYKGGIGEWAGAIIRCSHAFCYCWLASSRYEGLAVSNFRPNRV